MAGSSSKDFSWTLAIKITLCLESFYSAKLVSKSSSIAENKKKKGTKFDIYQMLNPERPVTAIQTTRSQKFD